MLGTTLNARDLFGEATPGQAHPYPIHPWSPFLYADGGGAATGGDDGGEGQGADPGADDDPTGDPEGDEDPEGDDGQDPEDLGDKGKKALRELRRENRQLKAQLRKSADAPKNGSDKGGKDTDGQDIEAIRQQARDEARAEVWTERVEAAAIAAASGRLANPNLVGRLVDLSDVPANDKGRPDRDAITELIDELLEDEPYLAVQSATDRGRRFQGGADSGARKPTKKAAASLGEAVANAIAGKTG